MYNLYIPTYFGGGISRIRSIYFRTLLNAYSIVSSAHYHHERHAINIAAVNTPHYVTRNEIISCRDGAEKATVAFKLALRIIIKSLLRRFIGRIPNTAFACVCVCARALARATEEKQFPVAIEGTRRIIIH